MTWNYRIIKHDNERPIHFAIHEVFYNDRGKIAGWTTEPISLVGDNVEEVKQALKHMEADTKRPVLKESELEQITKAANLGAKT